MFNFLKNMMPAEDSVDLKELYENGAKIIDVTTPAEFNMGHIKGSKNIPLQNIANHINEFNQDEPLILCCASGNRSGSARRMFQNQGFSNVHNGGGWQRLKYTIEG